MEDCVRGFSFMPKDNLEVMNLQYIEDGELERTWRNSRRQRHKEQEQQIYNEFVKEQDILKTVCSDDPYQFLEELPESCIKELLDLELQRMKQEVEQEVVQVEDQAQEGAGDSQPQPSSPADALADDSDTETHADEYVFQIFDDEKEDELSDAEAVLDSPTSPPTVRERFDDHNPSTTPPLSPDKESSKSSENVSNMIESSIYCARVREIRTKLDEEIMSVMLSVEQINIMDIDPDDLVKMSRRSSQFCTRFQRIHIYQLQRQIHDLKRNIHLSMPFARHTQFQSQMVRIVSLHQNLLQAWQVFHKSIEQTVLVQSSSDLATVLMKATREATAVAREVPAPKHIAAAGDLYTTNLDASCDKLEVLMSEYTAQVSKYMNTCNKINSSVTRKSDKSNKRSIGTWSKSGSKKNGAESRLSMYSLDSLRISLAPKSSGSKGNPTSDVARGGRQRSPQQEPPAPAAPKSKQTPRSRRPLMRDPHEGRQRVKRSPRDSEVRTMVEGVEMCASSFVTSRNPSPMHNAMLRVSRNNTPRNIPQGTPRIKSPKPKRARSPINNARVSPKRIPKASAYAKPIDNAEKGLARAKVRDKKFEARILEASGQTVRSDAPKSDTVKSGVDLVAEVVPGSPKSLKASAVVSAKNSPRISELVSCEKRDESRNTSRGVDSRPKHASPNISPKLVVKAPSETPLLTTTNPKSDEKCEVTRIVRQVCGNETGGRIERVSGSKNAQLLCVSSSSPRQPSTPQLLKILEETIQKKMPKALLKSDETKNTDRHRMAFNIPEQTRERLFEYRTKFVQHMLASPMYANSTVGKPWEMVGSVSEQIIDDLLAQCATEMQLYDLVQELYNAETG